jgi:hypothetical protein
LARLLAYVGSLMATPKHHTEDRNKLPTDDVTQDLPGNPQPCRQNIFWPSLVLVVILAAAVLQLRSEGRLWWCACGQPNIWTSDVWSSHNSQHVFDPYSFTHVLHGLILCGLLTLICPKLPTTWRFCLAIAIEAIWETFENSDFVIRRYRMLAIALNYEGDTIANSLGDILSCGVGYVIARRLGLRRSVWLFIGIEGVLILWIGDSLLLDVVRLICVH